MIFCQVKDLLGHVRQVLELAFVNKCKISFFYSLCAMWFMFYWAVLLLTTSTPPGLDAEVRSFRNYVLVV